VNLTSIDTEEGRKPVQEDIVREPRIGFEHVLPEPRSIEVIKTHVLVGQELSSFAMLIVTSIDGTTLCEFESLDNIAVLGQDLKKIVRDTLGISRHEFRLLHELSIVTDSVLFEDISNGPSTRLTLVRNTIEQAYEQKIFEYFAIYDNGSGLVVGETLVRRQFLQMMKHGLAPFQFTQDNLPIRHMLEKLTQQGFVDESGNLNYDQFSAYVRSTKPEGRTTEDEIDQLEQEMRGMRDELSEEELKELASRMARDSKDPVLRDHLEKQFVLGPTGS
jgi:hypothetical protein